jgi:uncharacterized flavoprotein (TIGR03862 family)
MKKSISIVGGGTGALFFAAFLDHEKYEVTIYEKQKSLGRKFLVAGDGGFNLTHSEPIDNLKLRYTPTGFLEACLTHFTNEDLIKWLAYIGIPTYIGSSKRVFPEKGIKPIAVLKSIEAQLLKKNVKFNFGKTFTGWDDNGHLIFNSNEIINSDINVFALGGGSWKVTGSDGTWLDTFSKQGIKTTPFKASNCAFQIDWDKEFMKKFEGQPFKNISISIGETQQKGEVVITKFGIEGNAIYALSPMIQNQLSAKNEALIYIDFKPTLNSKVIIQKMSTSKLNVTQTLKRVLKLTSVQVFLIKNELTREEYLDFSILTNLIKKFPLKIIGSAPIDEAISTSGGILLSEVNSNFELVDMNNNYCIGEMLNWDAPTGGYLIQACASMGVNLAHKLNNQ